MKKYLYMVMAAAALMVVGCEKNIETKPEGGETSGSFSLTVELPTDTKITFDGADGYKSSWDEGDAIAVQTSEPSANGPAKYDVYRLDEGCEGTKKGTFSGSVPPLQGGKVLYPVKGWDTSTETLNGDGPRYHFNNEYVWDEAANEENNILSVVPMAGKVSGTTITDFDYVAGAISITYSKIPLTTAKFVVTLTGPNLTGFANLNNSGTNLSAPTDDDTKGNTITIYMNSDKETQLGGTAYNAQFFFPVPAGTYTGLTMELEREDGITIGGSKYSMATGKTLMVDNKELKKLPTIVPKFPEFYFTEVATGDRITNGNYILAFDRGVVEGEHKAWVNGDDNFREVFSGTIITIEEMAFIDSNYWGKTGLKLDLADYETGVWQMTYDSRTGKWSAKTADKGTFTPYVNWETDWFGNYTGFVEIKQNDYDYLLYYWTGDEVDRKWSSLGGIPTTDPIFDNGCFVWNSSSNSNIKLFRFIAESDIQ